jgi:hypothetical protein
LLRALLIVIVCVALATAACGDGGDNGDGPTATSAATATGEALRTPVEDAMLDEVIELAVSLNTMTRAQAICVFQDHPSIYRDFLRETGIDESGVFDEEELRSQFEALKRDYAVQLDRCFTISGG